MSPERADQKLKIIPHTEVIEDAVLDVKVEKQTDGKILTLPNAISVLGLGMVIKGCTNIESVGGLGLIVGGRLMDLLDGYVARHIKGQESNLGKIIDATSDKIANLAILLSLWGSGLAPKPVLGAFLAQNVFNAAVTTTKLIKNPEEVYETPKAGKYSTALSVVSMGSFAAAEILNRHSPGHPAVVALGATAWAAAAGWAVLGIPASKEYYDRLK